MNNASVVSSLALSEAGGVVELVVDIGAILATSKG